MSNQTKQKHFASSLPTILLLPIYFILTPESTLEIWLQLKVDISSAELNYISIHCTQYELGALLKGLTSAIQYVCHLLSFL